MSILAPSRRKPEVPAVSAILRSLRAVLALALALILADPVRAVTMAAPSSLRPAAALLGLALLGLAPAVLYVIAPALPGASLRAARSGLALACRAVRLAVRTLGRQGSAGHGRRPVPAGTMAARRAAGREAIMARKSDVRPYVIVRGGSIPATAEVPAVSGLAPVAVVSPGSGRIFDAPAPGILRVYHPGEPFSATNPATVPGGKGYPTVVGYLRAGGCMTARTLGRATDIGTIPADDPRRVTPEGAAVVLRTALVRPVRTPAPEPEGAVALRLLAAHGEAPRPVPAPEPSPEAVALAASLVALGFTPDRVAAALAAAGHGPEAPAPVVAPEAVTVAPAITREPSPEAVTVPAVTTAPAALVIGRGDGPAAPARKGRQGTGGGPRKGTAYAAAVAACARLAVVVREDGPAAAPSSRPWAAIRAALAVTGPTGMTPEQAAAIVARVKRDTGRRITPGK